MMHLRGQLETKFFRVKQSQGNTAYLHLNFSHESWKYMTDYIGSTCEMKKEEKQICRRRVCHAIMQKKVRVPTYIGTFEINTTEGVKCM